MSSTAKAGSEREGKRAAANISHPRRSVLYMPGSNRRALDKARTLPADALILDLEDAVAPDAKEGARANVRQVLAERSAYGLREVVVRVNGLVSLCTCLLAARAAGIAVLDGVYLDLNDQAGFAASCRQGRELGFDGKTLIHPKQLATANAAFRPSPEEIEQARAIVAAFEEAQAAGKGLVVVNGKLVENLHVAEAKRHLAHHEAIAALEAGAA
jgi:citrate lyase beta subunit